MKISTDIYKLTPTAYMRKLFRTWLAGHWYVFALIFMACAGMSFIVPQFVYIGLMVIFIIVPLMLAYVYFYYALSKECVSAIRNGLSEFSQDGITRVYLTPDGMLRGRESFAWTQFCRYEDCEDAIMLFLQGSRYKFHFYPYWAFHTQDELVKTLQLIDSRLPGKKRQFMETFVDLKDS